MRHKIRSVVLCLLVFAVAAFAQSGKTVRVVVKEAKVYATPSAFGKVIGTLKYTARITVVEEKSGWTKVTFTGGKQGWVYSSSLEGGKTTLKAGSKDTATGASADEVALAGKGFSREVEDKYKKDNKVDFREVDRMEKQIVPIGAIKAFIVKGGLDSGDTGGDR